MSDTIDTIKQFVLAEFLPDVPFERLADDEDLLAAGVIDSLGLLKVIAWLEDVFAVAVEDVDLEPASFRSVAAIDEFVRSARTATPAR